MRRDTILFSLAVMLAALAFGARAEDVVVSGREAALRAAPGFGGPALLRPAEGARGIVLERQNEWVHVKLGSGAEGWVHELFVAQAPPIPLAFRPPPAVAPVAGPAEETTSSAQEFGAKEDARGAPPPAPGVAAVTDAARIARLGVELADARWQAGQARKEAEALGARLAEAEQARNAASRERDLARAESALLSQAARESSATAAQMQVLEEQVQRTNEVVAALSARSAATLAEAAELRSTIEQRVKAGIDAAREEGRSVEAAARAEEVAKLKAARDAEVKALLAEHEAVYDRFVVFVTQRHEKDLARNRKSADADCQAAIVALKARQAEEIRRVGKQSGWEAEFNKAVNEEVARQLDGARMNWEAKQRGDRLDLDRALGEQAERLQQHCAAESLASVNQALAGMRVEMENRIRQQQEQSDLHCQVALELVLERASRGGDLADIRKKLAQEQERNRVQGEAAPAPAPAPPEEQQAPAPVEEKPEVRTPSGKDPETLGRPSTRSGPPR